MSAPLQIPKYTTECTLCGKKFVADPVEIDPASTSQRFQKMAGALANHVRTTHQAEVIGAEPQAMNIIMAAAQQFVGWLTLRHFQTEDPGLIAAMNIIRRDIHNLTRARYATNEQIEKRVDDALSKVKHAAKVRDIVVSLMIELRDALTEQGQFTTAPPPTNPAAEPEPTPPALQ